MLQEAVEEYIASLSSHEDERGRSNQNTMAAYRNDLGQLCTYLSQHDIENWPQVTREHVAGYLLE
ncbi:MAG: site-specific integrase, partial [Ktedonobacteraceae bacterium]